jgi:hypothetical protein
MISGMYMEFVGGLGDVINRFHQCEWYESLARLGNDETATVVLMSHNPHVKELFLWNPKVDRIKIIDIGFDGLLFDPAWRVKMGLPQEAPFAPKTVDKIEYYPSPADLPLIEEAKALGPYVAFSMSAGTNGSRDIPPDAAEAAADIAISNGFKVVTLGRGYSHNFSNGIPVMTHREKRLTPRAGVVDFIDLLTVPGCAKIVENASFVLTAHSSVCLMSWYMGKRTFLSYDEFVESVYVPLGNEGYLFGRGRPGNDSMMHADFTRERFERFIKQP